MVTVIERPVSEQPVVSDRLAQRHPLLTRWAEQDMSDILAEYGARAEDQPTARSYHRPAPGFAYGVPMAGVRYYSFLPER